MKTLFVLVGKIDPYRVIPQNQFVFMEILDYEPTEILFDIGESDGTTALFIFCRSSLLTMLLRELVQTINFIIRKQISFRTIRTVFQFNSYPYIGTLLIITYQERKSRKKALNDIVRRTKF